jgi:protein gp37
MSAKSKISWTDSTWNPVTGCNKVSVGCANCYAHTYAQRFHKGDFSVKLHPGKLDVPLHWKKGRKIFVNSMSDLFHPDVPNDYIDLVFAIMALSQQHTFQILTKRPIRMLEWFSRMPVIAPASNAYDRTAKTVFEWILGLGNEIESFIKSIEIQSDELSELQWPLPNVMIGASVENQLTGDERIPILRKIPAAKRFISAEPLLGQVDFGNNDEIDWVIVGGETGPKARPMHPQWVRSIRDQCKAANIPLFFKSWGEWKATVYPNPDTLRLCNDGRHFPWVGLSNTPADCKHPIGVNKVGAKLSGRMLDGVEHMEFPK